VHVLQTVYARGRDGIEQVALNYARGLVAVGARVTTVAGLPPELEAEHAAAGARVVRDRHLGSLLHGFDPAAILRYALMMRREAVDAVVVHNGKAHHLMRRAAPARIPVASVMHLDNYRHRIGADVIVCLNAAQRDRVAALLPPADRARRRLAVLANPLPVDDMPDLRPADVRIAGWRDRGRLVVGTLCRIVEEKGLETLIDAAAALAADGPPVEVRIGGEGPAREALEARARALGIGELVRFEGWIGDRRGFYRGLDAFALPSRREAFGLVAAEAMYYGVPVVSTDTDGVRGQVAHGATGLLVPIGDAPALASALRELADAPERSAHIAMAAREATVARCGREPVARGLLDALRAWRPG
jgi:glycosyltransferase involved in cell wall biosynthesis